MVMKATLLDNLTLRDLVDGYRDNGENGVIAFGGKLNVRPAYQRAFVYQPVDRDRVMRSVYNNLPLNVMYWAKNPDGTFEIIDGQQRTISMCQFITNDDGYGNPIAINFDGRRTQTFENLSPEKQKQILDDYKLQVYVCDGTDDEKLDWFHTINIAGKVMTEQELLNADYTGMWLTHAKSYFSKRTNNPAINLAFYDNDIKHSLLSISGEDANRQDLLELVLQWICDSDIDEYPEIKYYMAKHRSDENADELINYYKSVIGWVKQIFSNYRKEMRGLPWGILYNKYHNDHYDADALENKLLHLFDLYDIDPDGLKKAGFYEYVLSGDRTLIWHRVFSDKQQRMAYQHQNKCCGVCGRELPLKELEAHHKIAFVDGGETTIENCLMLCHDCHADITARQNHEK